MYFRSVATMWAGSVDVNDIRSIVIVYRYHGSPSCVRDDVEQALVDDAPVLGEVDAGRGHAVQAAPAGLRSLCGEGQHTHTGRNGPA